MSVSPRRIETLIWVLIYAGLLILGWGLAVRRNDAALGAGMTTLGVVLAALGVVLVWVRARLQTPVNAPHEPANEN